MTNFQSKPSRLQGFFKVAASLTFFTLVMTVLSLGRVQAATAATPEAKLTEGSIAAFISEKPANDTVLARVDGKEIRRSELVAILNSVLRNADPRLRDMPLDRIYDKLMVEVVNSKIISAAAKNDKLDKSPEVVAEVNDFQDKLLQQKYLEAKLGNKEPTEAELQGDYQKFLAANPPKEEAHARHILLKTEKQANDIIARLKKGEDFKKLADKSSIDRNAKNGGDLGFFSREEMVPEFSTAAFALKPKGFSEKPVKTEYGFHVIYLEEFRTAKPPAFAEVKEQLVNDYMQNAATKLVDDLRAKSKIEVFTLDGKTPLQK
ncbi:MAG: peptidylprolyl isomerase [Candidatus Pacebacteria bacterium]|nr:peptidylprolyl isomerase [Candidatus Paceibacterota bacterium]